MLVGWEGLIRRIWPVASAVRRRPPVSGCTGLASADRRDATTWPCSETSGGAPTSTYRTTHATRDPKGRHEIMSEISEQFAQQRPGTHGRSGSGCGPPRLRRAVRRHRDRSTGGCGWRAVDGRGRRASGADPERARAGRRRHSRPLVSAVVAAAAALVVALVVVHSPGRRGAQRISPGRHEPRRTPAHRVTAAGSSSAISARPGRCCRGPGTSLTCC